EQFGDHARLSVEEFTVDAWPTAQVVDREQLWRRRKLGLEFRRDIFRYRPIAGFAEDALAVCAAQEAYERLRLLRIRGGRGDGDWILDENGRVGDDVVDLLAFLLGGDGFVFVGEHGVALAADEGLQRLARALGLDGHVREEGPEVVDALVRRLAELHLRAVAGHDDPPAAAL